MKKQQITWQLDPDTIKKVKKLAKNSKKSIQVTADELMQESLKNYNV